MYLCLFILLITLALAYFLATGNGYQQKGECIQNAELNARVFGGNYSHREFYIFSITAALSLDGKQEVTFRAFESSVPLLFTRLGIQLRKAIRKEAETEDRVNGKVHLKLIRHAQDGTQELFYDTALLMKFHFPCGRAVWSVLKDSPSPWKDQKAWEELGKRAFPRSSQLEMVRNADRLLADTCVPYSVSLQLFASDWPDAAMGWLQCSPNIAVLKAKGEQDWSYSFRPAPTWDDVVIRGLEEVLLPVGKDYVRVMA